MNLFTFSGQIKVFLKGRKCNGLLKDNIEIITQKIRITLFRGHCEKDEKILREFEVGLIYFAYFLSFRVREKGTSPISIIVCPMN